MGYKTSWISLGSEKKTLRKDKFLREMEKVLPYQEMRDIINPFYKLKWWWRPKTDGILLLKMYCLQIWFGLSDPAVEEEIYDSISFQKFLDIDLLSDNIPDETTLLRFRHLLERHELQEKLFKLMNRKLKEKGLIMQRWTLVDATIIHAPSSTKNASKKRDPEMTSTKKWNQYYFGMKAHIGVNGDTWVVHTVKYGTAREHDSQKFGELLHGKEDYYSWDKAYWSNDIKHICREKWVVYGILDKAWRNRKLSWKQEKRNRRRQRVKAKVEHPFQVIKCQRNYRKARYRWLKKNGLQIVFMMWLVNMFKMRKYFLK